MLSFIERLFTPSPEKPKPQKEPTPTPPPALKENAPDSFVEAKKNTPRIKDTEKEWQAPIGEQGPSQEDTGPISKSTPSLETENSQSETFAPPDSYVERRNAFRITDTGPAPDAASSRPEITKTPQIVRKAEEQEEAPVTQRSPVLTERGPQKKLDEEMPTAAE